jgi:hypothetical protein
MSEIKLIPRPFRRFGYQERKEYAKKMAEIEVAKALEDNSLVKKTAQKYEDVIKKYRRDLGLE